MDDKRLAQKRVKQLITSKQLPVPSKVLCADCGHVWKPGEAGHVYDHYLGYEAEHHSDVQVVCIACYCKRVRVRSIDSGR